MTSMWDNLVNNAGNAVESKKIQEITEDDWDELIGINLKVYFCAQEKLVGKNDK